MMNDYEKALIAIDIVNSPEFDGIMKTASRMFLIKLFQEKKSADYEEAFLVRNKKTGVHISMHKDSKAAERSANAYRSEPFKMHCEVQKVRIIPVENNDG